MSETYPTSLTISPAPPRGFSHSDEARTLGRDCCDDGVEWWEQPEGQLYLAPTGLLTGAEAASAVRGGRKALPLGGTGTAFSAVSVFLRTQGAGEDEDRPAGARVWTTSIEGLNAWALEEAETVRAFVATRLSALTEPRTCFAGLTMSDGPRLMGVLNVTPDSFSDGGDFLAAEAAIGHGLDMADAGAAIIDVGGESTRPGADPVSAEEELFRVLPVVHALAEQGHVVSVDTRHALVMDKALEAGAAIVNDVSALTTEADALDVVARRKAPVILMHMQGKPGTMQTDPRYACAPLDVYDYLAGRIAACERAGIPRSRIAVDPGIGFGKTPAHNLEILRHVGLFHGLGCPVLLGGSRKSLIGHVSGEADPKARLPGSLAVALEGARQGIQMLRVHDVAETRQALALQAAMAG